MKKIIKILLITAGALLLFIYRNDFRQQVLGQTSQAIGDLTIDWGVPAGKPIFVVTNFMPGDEEKRTVKIMNTSTKSRIVGIQGIKTSLLGLLANQLEFTISQNGSDLYGGSRGTRTLTHFFLESLIFNSVKLFTLNPGETKIVTFKVKFKNNAGNLYQKTKVVFDLKVGYYLTEQMGCGGIKFPGPFNLPFPQKCFFTK